jgi:hypothetical protein
MTPVVELHSLQARLLAGAFPVPLDRDLRDLALETPSTHSSAMVDGDDARFPFFVSSSTHADPRGSARRISLSRIPL